VGKLPHPPDPLPVPAGIVRKRRGGRFWRLYLRGGPYLTRWNVFRDFGPIASSRFDHHLPPPRRQTRAILYAAADITTCLAEFFQDTRVIHRSRRAPWLCGFRIDRDLDLLDLTGTWPTAAGASMAINTGPRSTARLWSQAIHRDYPRIDGLLYSSSMHANRPCVALYERARASLPRTPGVDRPLNDPALEAGIRRGATAIGYRLR
jgi:hypothetical protein